MGLERLVTERHRPAERGRLGGARLARVGLDRRGTERQAWHVMARNITARRGEVRMAALARRGMAHLGAQGLAGKAWRGMPTSGAVSCGQALQATLGRALQRMAAPVEDGQAWSVGACLGKVENGASRSVTATVEGLAGLSGSAGSPQSCQYAAQQRQSQLSAASHIGALQPPK